MGGFLLLNDAEVQACVGMPGAILEVEKAFGNLASGDVQMPAKLYLEFPEVEGDLRIMPAAIGDRYAGVKVVNSHALNPQKGLPAVYGTYLLVSRETGIPIAIMEATYLTALRTGAASAVATRALARRDAATLGLVGSGVQAEFQLEAVNEVSDINRVFVWGPESDKARRDSFITRMALKYSHLEFAAAEELRAAASADIVCTTTPSHEPLVEATWVSPGSHINAVGADGPGKQELDPLILSRSRIFVDEWEQSTHGGEVNVPLTEGSLSLDQIAGALGDLLAGKVDGRRSDDEVTVFDSTGLAIEDLAVAASAYEMAVKEGLGQTILA